MYQKDVTVVSLTFLALYSGSIVISNWNLTACYWLCYNLFIVVCLLAAQCLLKCRSLLIVRSAPFGRVWPSDMCLVHGWVQECYPVLKWFSKLYAMDTGALGVLCGFWHQNLGSGAFGSCRLYGRVCRGWAHSGASHGCLIGLGYREFREQVKTSASCSSSCSLAVSAVCRTSLSCLGRPLPLGGVITVLACVLAQPQCLVGWYMKEPTVSQQKTVL